MRPDKTGHIKVVSSVSGSETEVPFADTVLRCIAVQGNLVGDLADLQAALEIAADAKVLADVHSDALSNINAVFADLEAGRSRGRTVLWFD